MSQCRFTENQESMLLLVYNPLSVKTYHHVRLPAIALHYTIRDFNDEEVEYQLVPLPAAVINLPGRSSTAIQELCFEAENIPPLGFTAYYIAPVRDQLEENEFAKKFSKSNQGKIEAEQEIIPFISNEYIKVTVDKVTGLLESIQHVDGVRIDVGQNFYFYAQGQQTLQSGAYSFRPDRQRPVAVTDKVAYNTIRGSLVKEIRQRFSDWITQIIRLYRGEEFVEMEWIIGPIPIGTDLGKEVVSLFTTNITSNGEFFTDSNSRQMMRRTCWNESANQQIKKPIAACYYPVTSRICIHSGNASVEMCILVDRTEGGTSFNDGEIELMVHRRLLTDDGFGLEETLNEESYGVGLVVKGKHRILFGNYRQEVDDQTFSERMSLYSRKWQYEPWLFLTSGEKLNRRKWQNVRNKRFSVLKLHGLPRHIHVLTLEPWKAGTVLLRLENTLESPIRERYRTDKSDGPEDFINKPTHITVELRKIFLQMNIKLVRETTLAANQWLDDARQMDWSTRYVYNGADDGILPEDAEETEDKPQKPADNKDSEEDPEYGRKKYVRQRFSDKSRSKIKTPVYADYDRRKRSINMSENVMENIINDTSVDEVRFNDTTESPANDTSIDLTTRFEVNDTVKFSEQFKFLVTQKTPKIGFLSRMKPSKLINEWAAETEEVASSEEDFSSNLKKRSPRRRNGSRSSKKTKPEETTSDDVDDGITKSIYEMYYKHRPRNQHKSFKHSEEQRMRRKKARRLRDKNDYDYDLEPTTKRYSRNKSKRVRGRGYSADMPFFLTDGKKFKGDRDYMTTDDGRRMREMGADDGHGKEYPAKTTAPRLHKRKNNSGMEADYSEEEDPDNVEKEIGERRMENNRRKRTLPKDDEVQVEPGGSEPIEDTDFVVTIRPTQIRTFVIWFENNRKNYNT
ncbi:lysosomal alpha-mannosidase-like isoform X2 [Spodoptera litura]|uniref:Lysosomal alpha-mannosidase-like isoform X2 n=1 Tax=Spodoptera litura TaxID=69820 RepID=A0A9J7EAY2_SPOLT|nr:lysosomal alpha-mannosidase-like isoform X2 [Spodoptera litura]